jgi:predicted HD phosphohydrolase
MATSEAEDWLALWASDNMHEGYTGSAASMDEAAADCLSAAEVEGLSSESVLAAANGDLVGYLRDFKTENSSGD